MPHLVEGHGWTRETSGVNRRTRRKVEVEEMLDDVIVRETFVVLRELRRLRVCDTDALKACMSRVVGEGAVEDDQGVLRSALVRHRLWISFWVDAVIQQHGTNTAILARIIFISFIATF